MVDRQSDLTVYDEYIRSLAKTLLILSGYFLGGISSRKMAITWQTRGKESFQFWTPERMDILEQPQSQHSHQTVMAFTTCWEMYGNGRKIGGA